MNFKNLLFALAFIISSGVVAQEAIVGMQKVFARHPQPSEEESAELKRLREILKKAPDQKELLKIIAQDRSKTELAEIIWDLMNKIHHFKKSLRNLINEPDVSIEPRGIQ
jgi:Skp family chaperone for outer membrane proteins